MLSPEPISEPIPPATHCWYLTGPTASGKTKIGIELAQRLGAEIISLDSMALYLGMDIGTAKPSAAERAQVPHHLLDLVEPTVDYSLSDYVTAAHAKIEEIRSRGKLPLFVGGTPLYLKSLLRGIFPGPPADWEFRQQIEAELQTVGIEVLHERLAMVDPLMAAKLHPHDKRRIIRALEVHRQTGEPLSHQQTQFDESHLPPGCKVFTLFWPREQLHRRIEARVDQMFAAGLVAEVQGLLDRYGSFGRTAAQAVGYREVLEYFDSPVVGDPHGMVATFERIKARTRQFARRQETWFRSLPECQLVPLTPESTPASVAEMILDQGTG